MPYRITNADPEISIDLDALLKSIATLCRNQGIVDDAGWNTAVAGAFNATNASGLTASTRNLLIQFFSKLVKIG